MVVAAKSSALPCLGKVHDLPCICVHSDRPGHGSRGTVLGPSADMRSLTRVVLLLNQVVSCPECHQVRVVGRGWNADRPGATDICVAELICELLQLVGVKVIVIPEYMVVAWPAGALDTLVRAKVEVKLCRVCDANINGGAGGDVARFARLLFLFRSEKPRVMPLFDDDEGDSWFVVIFQLDAILPEGCEHMLKNLHKLTLADAVSVHDDPVWLEASGGLVKHHEVILDHG